MLNWLNENSGALSVIANVGMLTIWLVYLQLFLVSFRKQRKAKIIVNRGVGTGLDSHCLVSNMSAEAIYMQSILATVRTEQGSWTAPVAAAATSDDDDGSGNPARRDSRQGPLNAGAFVDLGPFEKLMYQAVGQGLSEERPVPPLENVRSVEIMVIAIYGSDDKLVGARRRFTVVEEGVARRLRPDSVSTHQLGGWSNRRELERTMRDTYLQ